jgi:hypothetical protein
MSFNRDAIDNARKLQNLPPITDEEFKILTGEAIAPEVKPEEEVVAPPPQLPKELSDEELLELVSKKTGRSLKSFDELKPAPEVVDEAKRKEERESNKISWAFQQKIVKKDEYEGFIADSKSPEELVYRFRLQEAKKEDPELDENEFRSEFEEEFGLSNDASARRKKNGSDNLTRLANDLLRQNYGSVYEIESKYSAFEKAQAEEAKKTALLKQGFPAYQKTLDGIKSDLSKIKTQFAEGDEIEVEAISSTIDEVLSSMSDPEWAAEKILNGYSAESLKQVAWSAMLQKDFPVIVKKIVDQALFKKGAGVKGVLKFDHSGEQNEFEMTDQQKILKNLIEQNKTANVAVN